jgi:SPP1 gp7 family putative phage head morphogenesis protein
MDIGHYETELILRETEADVARVYRQATDEVEKKLEEYLRKFKVKDQIKREQLKAGEITKAEYDYWRTGQIAIGKRWTEMKDTLAQDLHNANNLARSIVQGHMPEVYAVNHNYATFQVEKDSLVDTSYTLYDRQTVERLIRDQPDLLPPPGQRMKERIAAGKDIAWQRGHIQSVMTQSILQGESIPHIAQRIARTMGESNRKSTVRYARTATTGAENAGRVDAYKRAEDMGIELEQEWLATLDSRTRDSHRDMDGESVKVGETFSNGCRYPGDPRGPAAEIWNCRCTLVSRVEGVNQSDAPRNSNLGDMSYEEWKQGVEHTEKISGEMKFKETVINSHGDKVKVLTENSQYSYTPTAPRPLNDKLELEQKAIAERLRDAGIHVSDNNTVTLYNVCSPEHAEYVRKHGFVGTTSPVGGMVSEDINLRSFFGLDKAWDAEWSSGGYVMFEIEVPVQYIRQAAQNQYEVYIEGTVTRRSNGVWEPDILPTSTFYDRMAVKKYKRRHGL